MASIVHAYQWDKGNDQFFVSLSPGKDEICLYESKFVNKSYTTQRVHTKSEFDSIQSYTYSSTQEGVICAGQSNGVVNICDVLKPESQTIKLRPKQSRPCNSVSFNSQGLIAAGLDKVRNDNSLLIWNSSTNDKFPIESYLPNEVVASVSFLSNQQPNSLLCGSYKFIREFDIRSPSSVFQTAAKCSHGITVNPFNDWYFTTYSEDGAFAYWDRRMIKSGQTTEPALYMNRLFGESTRKNSYFGCFRFSLSNSKEFAIINDGDLMRRWQIGIVPNNNFLQGPAEQESRHSYISRNDTLFVSCVLDSKTDYDKVVAFDYTSDMASPYSVNFMCIRQSGQVFRMKCVESPDCAIFDPHNNVAVVDPERITLISNDDAPQTAGTAAGGATKAAQSAAVAATEDDEDDEDKEDDTYFHPDATFEGMLDYKSVLQGDISVIMKNRALKGYSLDCEKNINLLDNEHGDGYLKYTWQWLLCARRAEEKKSMLSDVLDLGFEGVLGIWEGSSGLSGQNRIRTSNRQVITENDFEKAVTTAMSKSSKNVFVSPKVAGGSKHARRRLCLRVAGWNFDLRELDREMESLVSQSKYEQAAGWAVFHGDVGRAVACLASSKKERLRLMSTAVAGYLAYKDSNKNSPWRDQCRKLASELDDPYLRAIFAFISDGSWIDVLDEGSLPLVERLGIALRFLSDSELTTYLNRIADRAVQNGDLEGIMLTGITPRVVPLLQSYVDKTGDVQTASLILSFGCTRYFEHQKAQCWVEEYRRLLNSWKLFPQRAKFDVARARLSTNYSGQVTTKPPPKQIYLRCTQCKKTINRPSTSPLQMTKRQQPHDKSKKVPITKCQNCNHPLPRCAVCLLSLGSYLPSNRSPSPSELAKQFEQWPTFCMSCNHGLHSGHASEWFDKHDMCPVPDCNCLCNSK